MEDLPNDGSSFYIPEVPAEQKIEMSEEKQRAVAAYPILDELLTWFDEAIKNTDSIEILKADARRRNKSHEVMVEAYDITRELLTIKRGELESIKTTFPM